MDRSSEGCRVLGLNSTPQVAVFGLGCAAVGALAASLSWGALEMETVSPRMSESPHAVSTRQVIGNGVNSNAGLVGEVVHNDSCGHAHHGDDCAFCKARARRAQEAANAPFVPLHQRPDYCVEPPDILMVNVVPVGLEETPTDKQPIRGEHLVDADGSINLGSWGKLQVAGLTLAEIKRDVETLVDAAATQQRVDVSVLKQNSHVYFVVTEGNAEGDTVARYPVQGCETVLDAIASAGPINEMGKKRIWIARPTAGGVDTIIPIRWQWSNPTTMVAINPALQSGDRVFISTPPSWVAFVERAVRLSRNRQANRLPAGTWSESQAQ